MLHADVGQQANNDSLIRQCMKVNFQGKFPILKILCTKIAADTKENLSETVTDYRIEEAQFPGRAALWLRNSEPVTARYWS